MKLDLHQSIPLMDEKRRTCMEIESSFSTIKEDVPKILQEDTLERYKSESNSFPTKELAFEFKLHNTEVEKLVFTSDEGEERVLATIGEGPK